MLEWIELTHEYIFHIEVPIYPKISVILTIVLSVALYTSNCPHSTYLWCDYVYRYLSLNMIVFVNDIKICE